MTNIIDGKALAKKIKGQIVKEVAKPGAKRPNLAIIFVGNNSDSCLYVEKKEKAAKEVGVDTHLYKCAPDIGQEKVLETIDFLNKDEAIDAILVQLPLPQDQDYNTDEIIACIKPAKDVDRFHPENIGPIRNTCDSGLIMPPVFGAVLEMLNSINCQLEDKLVTIISNSEIFGSSLAKALECRGAQTNVCSANDQELAAKTQEADILIPAIGRPKFITRDMIKEEVIIIDVGITRDKGSVFGDVNLTDVKDKAGYISPVPGGVGPLTVALTLKNTLELHMRRKNRSNL